MPPLWPGPDDGSHTPSLSTRPPHPSIPRLQNSLPFKSQHSLPSRHRRRNSAGRRLDLPLFLFPFPQGRPRIAVCGLANSMAEYFTPPARPPPPAPWMPLFFIAVLASMWAFPLWLRFEPLVLQAVNQLSIMVSLAVPLLLVFFLHWIASPASSSPNSRHLQYPNSRQTFGSASGSYSDSQSFVWGMFLIFILFLLLNTTARSVVGG